MLTELTQHCNLASPFSDCRPSRMGLVNSEIRAGSFEIGTCVAGASKQTGCNVMLQLQQLTCVMSAYISHPAKITKHLSLLSLD